MSSFLPNLYSTLFKVKCVFLKGQAKQSIARQSTQNSNALGLTIQSAFSALGSSKND